MKKVYKPKKTQDPGFMCSHCTKWVPETKRMGTKNRNHCPSCLWSAHVDDVVSGDRKSHCGGQMEPIGLTFKNAGVDKYGKPRQGELMLIHKCARCWKYSINRIAADDETQEIMNIFEKSLTLPEEELEKLKTQNINIITKEQETELKKQLFGIGSKE